ncbi:RNA-binding cell elongation regulator Jag/EloR [Lentilactobacillus sp. SPB1-3]|uniref:RNA-binding cell elongation regulator Jag/EloR n=1 Tax=Lentilactobacillus terminaliae TaxID=3003483 RepID=A0ACD5DF87_9LACO|nr:RNA-binding cell elongation regulator Jag/EloR [Lentilactobacillus sp. SPB1-3]MCZ0976297.1 protein jag [Lentilactobacillus sp. SPB1-3]
MTTYSGKTIEEAIANGLSDLSLNRNQVEVTVKVQPRNGFFGIGRKLAQVEINKIELPVSQDEPSKTNDVNMVKQTVKSSSSSNSVVEEDDENDNASLNDIVSDLEVYLHDVITAMGFDHKLTVDLKNHHSLYIDIDADESKQSLLIGHHGRTINALQGLAQVFVNRLGANNLNVVLDIANYRARRSEALAQLAEKTARNAIANGKPVYLNPMPAFERKEIHNVLVDNPHVITYSTGREPHRVIVVAPK